MSDYIVTARAIPDRERQALCDAALGSALIGRSPLGGTFRASYGFGIIFKRSKCDEVLARAPFLESYLQLILGRPVPREILRLWRQPFWSSLGASNAFYINLLLVPVGAGVGPHVDATLAMPCGSPRTLPLAVSVLYLQMPRVCEGGELQLYRGGRQVARITPTEGMLVHFRGELTHEVTKLRAPAASAYDASEHSGQVAAEADSRRRLLDSNGDVGNIGNAQDTAHARVRASLVCEQYHLGARAMARLPDFKLQSRRDFATVLQSQRTRPPPALQLD